MKTVNHLKSPLFILFFTIHSLAFAQGNLNMESMSIGPRFQGTLNYRKLVLNTDDVKYEKILQERNAREKQMQSYGIGLGFVIPYGEKFMMLYDFNFAVMGFDLGTVTHNPPIDDRTQEKGIQKYYYFDFPTRLGYRIPISDFDITIAAGVSPGMLVSARSQMEYTYTNGTIEEREESDSYSEDFNLFGLGSIGIGSELVQDIYVRVDLEYKRGFLNVSSKQISPQLYSYGLCLGAYYNF